jgi:hypothetical protein
LIGYIVKHGEFGLGRIRSVENRRVTVDFFSPQKTATLTAGIERAFLSVGSVCTVPVPEILPGMISEILSGLRKEIGDESRERAGI